MIAWHVPGNLFGMSARKSLWMLVLLPAASFAAAPPAQAKAEEKPREIVVVDDVGVGDHFPSQVPGTGPYRLPPREEPVAPRTEEPQRAASDPSEWATLDKPAQPAEAHRPLPAEPLRQAPAAAPVALAPPPAAPTVSAPIAVAPVPAAPASAPVAAPAPAASPAAPVVPDLDRQALARASAALVQGRCETELPALAELLEQSDRSDTRARARILRARCFTQRAKTEQAKAEYLAYVHDFPNGAWVAEARGAVAPQ
jgi:hypothetical protein